MSILKISLVASLLIIWPSPRSATISVQSALYPGWALDKEWIAKNDAPYLEIRKACDKIRRGTAGFDLGSNLPSRADNSISDWKSDKKSALKLYRASYLLATARGINYKYCFDFQDSRTVRILCDAWLKMPTQKSYEFARYGYMFVSAFDPDRLTRIDLFERLLSREPDDEGLMAAWVYVSYSALSDVASSNRAIKFAEKIYRKHPKKLESVGFLLLAYNDAWLSDNSKTEYLEKAIKFTRIRQSMLPKDHPWYGKEEPSIKMYEQWIKEHGKRK